MICRARSLGLAAFVLFVARPALAEDAAAACIQAANDGQRLQQSGKFLQSRQLLSRCSQADCPPAIQTDCGEWSLQLGAKMPSLTLGITDAAGAEVVDAELVLDGKNLQSAPGLAVEMDPGVHQLLARTKDGAAGTVRFVAHEGEHSRKVVLKLGPPPAPKEATLPPRRTVPVGALVLGGVGLVIGGVGVGFAVAGGTRYGDLKEQCAPACSDDSVASARRISIVGDVLLTTGIVTLAGAALWYVIAPKHEPITTAVRF